MVVVDPRKIKIVQPTPPTESRHGPAALDLEAIPCTEPTPAAPPVDPAKIARAIRSTATTHTALAPDSEAMGNTEPTTPAPPVDPVLFTIRQLGRTLDDIERLRIMNGNRISAGKREGVELPWMDTISSQLDALEHSVELELKRAWRKHPLAAWAKTIPGAGEVLMGRLIAEIGDPADRPNPAKLLAYCGHGDPARAGQVPKSATQEELFKRGSPAAKKATWKLAYQFMRTVGSSAQTTRSSKSKGWPSAPDSASATTTAMPIAPAPRHSSRSPYRDVYDERKAATVGKLHDKPCKRCGPSGHPAPAGSPWSDAHRHADALRIVGKRFLIDLWVASRHRKYESYETFAGGE